MGDKHPVPAPSERSRARLEVVRTAAALIAALASTAGLIVTLLYKS